MLKTLRKKLTLLAACLTGGVVVLVCLVSFLLIRRQYLRSRELAFPLAVSAVQTQWQMEGHLSAEWLSVSAQANRITIAAWENGIPLSYGLADPVQAESLRAAAPALAREGDGCFTRGQYRCAWVSIPFAYGSRQLLVWQDTAPEREYLARLGALFFAIALVSLGAVGALCYWVAGRAIAPAQEAMERQEFFVAAASHELRSPLTVLRTGFGVIRTDPEQTERYLTLMSRETDRMIRLVNELLLIAGGGRLRQSFTPAGVEPDTLLIDLADEMTPVAEKAGVLLEVRLPDEAAAPVRGDADLLRQLLTILIDNALRYAPAGSCVELSLRQKGRQCLFSVADHGPGVPDEEKERIFDRFYRGSRSRTDPAHFGLGLSVAKELAALHEGSIQVLDTPGGGATFRIALPYGAG